LEGQQEEIQEDEAPVKKLKLDDTGMQMEDQGSNAIVESNKIESAHVENKDNEQMGE